MAKQQVYDASAIQALKGLEPVRRMPGMYTHTVHPLHIMQEAIDNAVDEALAGFGKKITVTRAQGRLGGGRGRGPRHPGRHAPGGEEARGRGRLHHAARRRQVLALGRRRLPHLRRPARRRRVGVERAVQALRSHRVHATARSTSSRSRAASSRQKLKSEKSKEKRTGTVVRLWPDPEVLRLAEHPAGRARAPGALEGVSAAGPDDGARTSKARTRKTWKYERGMAQYFEMHARRPRAGRAAVHRREASSTRKRHRRDRAGRGRLVGDRLGRRGRRVRRQPRQPDPDALRRHARGGLPLRHLRGARRLHRHARARAQGREAHPRRPLAARLLHALGAHRAHAVPRPDQGEAHHAPRREAARDVRARRRSSCG